MKYRWFYHVMSWNSSVQYRARALSIEVGYPYSGTHYDNFWLNIYFNVYSDDNLTCILLIDIWNRVKLSEHCKLHQHILCGKISVGHIFDSWVFNYSFRCILNINQIKWKLVIEILYWMGDANHILIGFSLHIKEIKGLIN